MARKFECTADTLLILLERLKKMRWKQETRPIKTPAFYGPYPIYCDGKPLQEDVIARLKGDAQLFLEMVDDIYRGVPVEHLISGSFSDRWKTAEMLISLGKDNGLTAYDWRVAVNKKI